MLPSYVPGSQSRAQQNQYLVDALGRRHRSLDRQAANVLPSLLQQRHEVVDGQHDITDQLILSHAHVSDSDTHTQDLLQLKFDGRLDFGDLGAQIFVVGDGGWEFTSYKTVRIDVRVAEGQIYPWRDRDPRDEEFA
jgi:hypothetical protein